MGVIEAAALGRKRHVSELTPAKAARARMERDKLHFRCNFAIVCNCMLLVPS